MAVLCGMHAHNTVFGSKRSAISGVLFFWPTRVLNANGISIASTVSAAHTSVTDQQTDHATRLITIGRIYVRSTVMRSNNNCSTSRLLDWIPCFYHQTEQGNRRQQTSPAVWNHTLNYILP